MTKFYEKLRKRYFKALFAHFEANMIFSGKSTSVNLYFLDFYRCAEISEKTNIIFREKAGYTSNEGQTSITS